MYCIRECPKSNDSKMQKTHRERWRPCEQECRSWNDAAMVQGKLKLNCHQNLGRGMKEFSLEFWRWHSSDDTLISDFSPLKMWENILMFYISSLWYFVIAALGNKYKLILQFCFLNIACIYTLTSLSSVDSNLTFTLSPQMRLLLLAFLKDHRNDNTWISRKLQIRGNGMLS